jgi:hypothetical protein
MNFLYKHEFIIILFCIFLIVFPRNLMFGDSRNVCEFDGNAWNQMHEALKIGYVKGFMVGIIHVIEESVDKEGYAKRAYRRPDRAANIYYRVLGERDSLRHLFSSSDCKWVVGYEIYKINEELLRYPIYGITVGQIVDGLNELYEDYKNRSIKVQDAIYVFRKQIKGASQEEIEQILVYLRSDKKDLDALWLRDEDGKRKTFIKFP